MIANQDVNAIQQPPQADSDLELRFNVARGLQEVEEAWELVYKAYTRIGLIDTNDFGIHTNRAAVSPDTAVIVGHLGHQIGASLTVVRDGEHKLPLDEIYSEELDQLRSEGLRLSECGLLADRRAQLSRRASALFDLMVRAVDYAFRDGGTDLVIGVHPHHARFYTRAFGFSRLGPERTYAAVNDHPAVLLRLSHDVFTKLRPLPRALTYLQNHPIADDAYDGRFDFNADAVQGSRIACYLAKKQLSQMAANQSQPSLCETRRNVSNAALVVYR